MAAEPTDTARGLHAVHLLPGSINLQYSAVLETLSGDFLLCYYTASWGWCRGQVAAGLATVSVLGKLLPVLFGERGAEVGWETTHGVTCCTAVMLLVLCIEGESVQGAEEGQAGSAPEEAGPRSPAYFWECLLHSRGSGIELCNQVDNSFVS